MRYWNFIMFLTYSLRQGASKKSNFRYGKSKRWGVITPYMIL